MLNASFVFSFFKGKNTGLTDYLVSDDQEPDAFIRPSGLNENLDVMFGGQIAPNPNDLLDMQKFDTMLAGLKKRYDYMQSAILTLTFSPE